MIVESKAHAALLRLLSPMIELVSRLFVGIQNAPALLRQHGTDHVFQSQGCGIIQFALESVVIEVPAGDMEPVVVDHTLQLSRWVRVHIPIGFDLFIANLADRREGSRKIFFRLVAHSVKLHAQRTFCSFGQRRRRRQSRSQNYSSAG